MSLLKSKVNTSHITKLVIQFGSIFIVNNHVFQFLHGHSFCWSYIVIDRFTIISPTISESRWCKVISSTCIYKTHRSTYLQQHMNSSTNTTAAITDTITIGTTVPATVPSRLSLDAGSEYGATLTMIKPSIANVLLLS